MKKWSDIPLQQRITIKGILEKKYGSGFLDPKLTIDDFIMLFWRAFGKSIGEWGSPKFSNLRR